MYISITRDSRYIAVKYDTILSIIWGRKLKLGSEYELTKDTPYLALTDELWASFFQVPWRKVPWDIDIESALGYKSDYWGGGGGGGGGISKIKKWLWALKSKSS